MSILVTRPSPAGEELVSRLRTLGQVAWHFPLIEFSPGQQLPQLADQLAALGESETWDVCIYDGGWGGPKPPKDIVEMPDRAPDAVVEETMPLNMPLIYRLMGGGTSSKIGRAHV